MKIGILSQWFDPEPGPASLPGELAREFVRRGHDVQVLTGFPNYPTGRIYEGYRNQLRHDELRDGVRIRRVGIWPSHGDSSLGRVANYVSFGVSAVANGLDCLEDRDAVWVSNSPPTVAWPVKRLRRLGIPVVLHIMDLWPDNITSSGMVTSAVAGTSMLRVVNGWNASLYDNASKILTIAPGVVDLLQHRGADPEKLQYSPLWANEDVFHPEATTQIRHELGVDDDTVVLLYAGAIGELQGLDLLLQALRDVLAPVADQLECWFVGDGVWLSELRRVVEAMPPGSPRVRLLGRKPMSEMPAWISAADICYVGLKSDEHAEYSMPSKVQTTLAMGKPLLAAVKGNVDRLVRRTGVGFTAPNGDAAALRVQLEQAVALGRQGLARIGKVAALTYQEEFSLQSGAARVEEALAKAAGLNDKDQQDAALTVADAKPSDLQDIVTVHRNSFPNFFLTFLGPRFLSLFYEELLSDPTAVLLVAKRAGQPVGLVGGVIDERSFFANLRRRRTVDFARASAIAALQRPSIVPRLWRARQRDSEKPESTPPATLLSIAVEPSEQGRGTASLLLHNYTARMDELGVDAFTLSTDDSADNRAVGFYERQGLRRVRSYTTPEGRAMLEFEWRASPNS